MDTFCMKCHILFSGENKADIINLSSSEFVQRLIKVQRLTCLL